MRVALLQPTYWPEVRRGSERLVHDLGVSLVARGHDVTVITSHRRRRSVTVEDGLRVVRLRRPPERSPLDWYEHHVATVPGTLVELQRGRYDVVHAFFAPQAWAGVRWRDRGGPPVVFSIHGILNRRYLVKRRYRLELIEGAIARADAVNVLSEAARRSLRSLFGREPSVLPGGVNSANFVTNVQRASEPTLVCAASLGDPRKGAPLLFDAFELVQDQIPEARLEVVATSDPVMSRERFSLPQGARWVVGDRTQDLARAYATAWAGVLPAVDEAFGLVLIESLAAGTPVVALDSGACPEIVADEQVGWLAEPGDPTVLAAAMARALAEPPSGAVASACRARAAHWDWRKVVEEYEAEYGRVAAGARSGAPTRRRARRRPRRQ